MVNELIRRLDHCQALYQNNAIELAQEGLKRITNEVLEFHSKSPEWGVFERFERLYFLVGIEVSLGYAKYWYEKNDYEAARHWVSYANYQAKKIDGNIKERLKQFKKCYNDKMPLWMILCYEFLLSKP